MTMDYSENVTNGSININLTSTDHEDGTMMTKSQFIFYVSVRGVLLSAVMVFVSFLNISTIVVIYKYRVLQITSNALIVCFSVGHSLSIITASTFVLSDYAINRNTLAWKLNCILLGFLTVYQQTNNYFSVTAISIERVYSIYFPLHSYKSNSFGRMTKVALSILSISLIQTIIQNSIGFFTDDKRDTSRCTGFSIMGKYGVIFGMTIFSISSIVCFSMSLLIIVKLINRKRGQDLRSNTELNNAEYKATKMFITGNVHYVILTKQEVIQNTEVTRQ